MGGGGFPLGPNSHSGSEELRTGASWTLYESKKEYKLTIIRKNNKITRRMKKLIDTNVLMSEWRTALIQQTVRLRLRRGHGV